MSKFCLSFIVVGVSFQCDLPEEIIEKSIGITFPIVLREDNSPVITQENDENFYSVYLEDFFTNICKEFPECEDLFVDTGIQFMDPTISKHEVIQVPTNSCTLTEGVVVSEFHEDRKTDLLTREW